MRKLVLEEWLTLDGYAADAAGKLDFLPANDKDHYSDEQQLKFLEGVDTILLGRSTYELFVRFWPGATTEQETIADRLNSLPKLVFSNSLQEAPWGRWEPARVVRGDAVREIAELKERPGKSMVLWGSLSLARSLIRRGLIDEYHIQLCPTLLGGGARLFDAGAEASLRLVETRRYENGVVFLSYERR